MVAGVAADGILTLYGDLAGVEDAALDVQDVGVVCNDYGYHGHAGLHGEVEGALFEGEQLGLGGVGARALWEDVDGLALRLHVSCCAIKGGPCSLTVRAVDEDGLAECHWWDVVSGIAGRSGVRVIRTEPAEEGDPFELLLGGDAAVWREDCS